MISRMSHTSIFVLDQDSAKAFYTETLGFEERFDISMGEEFEGAGAGFRWLTVGPKDQPDLQIILSSCDMGRSPEAAAQLRALVASGTMGIGVMQTDDCHRTYEELVAKGVTFLSEPAERPYGIEATLRDDSGNMMSRSPSTPARLPRDGAAALRRVPGHERWPAAIGEEAFVVSGHRPYCPHQEGFVVAHREVAQHLALHADGSVHQEGRPCCAEPPVDGRELVDDVPRLFPEEARHCALVGPEKVEPHPRRALSDREGVVHLRDAHQEVGRVDAALRHESRQAAAHVVVGRPHRYDVVGVVDESEERVEPFSIIAHRVVNRIRGTEAHDRSSRPQTGQHRVHRARPRGRPHEPGHPADQRSGGTPWRF
jgi:catechol 2,3-dioxygenase-like lactoylglutathione lyase family enzyme